MSRTYKLYLQDILTAISRIEQLHIHMTEADFKANDLRVDGILFNLITIGEAIKNIPEEIRSQHPTTRWKEISRFRDRLVHHYFSLDFNIIWEIVTLHLPVLKTEVESLLSSLPLDDESAP